MKIFSGRSNKILAKQIAAKLDVKIGKSTFRQFADGELWVKYEENIRGQDVYIIQSTNPPAENILELVLMIDAAVRATADRVTAVIPYYGSARQDRWIYILLKFKVLPIYHLIIYMLEKLF